MVRRGAGLNANEAWRQLLEERQDIAPLELTADDHLASGINAVAPIAPICGLSRASFWRFSDLALAEARNVMGEIENLRVVDRSEHLSHD